MFSGSPSGGAWPPSSVHYYYCYTLSTAGEDVVEVNFSMDSVLTDIERGIAHDDVGFAN